MYIPFSDVNSGSFRHALREHSLTLDEQSTSDIMKAYDDLDTFPDVPPALSSLEQHPNIIPLIFSNGTQSMVENSVHRSKSLAPCSAVFKDIVTVDEVKKYKPAPEVYRHLGERARKWLPELEMRQMWLVSGNPFDVVGANAVGMRTAWVDRLGNGWCDSLMEARKGLLDITVRGVGEALDQITEFGK
ncbi:MAG: hypothetical protein Q9167_005671 [Letrouitia subvulpina]